MKTLKPIFSRPSPIGYELIYKCSKCGREFAMTDSSFFYCPTCGTKIDWGVITKANSEWINKYRDVLYNHDEELVAFMKRELTYWNDMINDGQKREMPMTDLTKKEILKINIGYYMNQGWGKRELIEKGFFTEEEFKIYEVE